MILGCMLQRPGERDAEREMGRETESECVMRERDERDEDEERVST